MEDYAGRCQTPALRLIYDNQEDINKSSGKKYMKVKDYLWIKIYYLN